MKNIFLKKILKISLIMIIITVNILFINNRTTFADDLDKVTLQLRWNHQFQFAGYYAAKWLGYYEDEGLDVDIKSGFKENGDILSSTEEVREGRAEFGIGAVDILIEENNGGDLVVISSIFQRSPVEFYLKDETPYRSLIDLTRLNTARRKNDLLDIELQAMLISEGITPDSDNLIKENVEFYVEDLIENKYDVIPSYLGTIDYYGDKKGVRLKTIRPIDYGIDFYGDSIFTSKALVEDNPKLVERFRKASIKGWEYALENPEEIAIKIANELEVSGRSKEELIDYNIAQANKVLELTFYPVVEIGNINPYRWLKMQEVLLRLNLVDGDVDFDKFIFSYEGIQNKKVEKIQKVFIVFVAISFLILIFIFLFHLAGKNRILEGEVKERIRAEERIRRSKKRYETIFNSALLGITVTSIDGVILQVNEKWLDMTGCSEEEIIGKNILEFISDEFKGSQIEAVKNFIDGNISSYEVERKYIRANGGYFWGKLFMTTIYDQDSEEVVNIGMVVDITSRRVGEEAVVRSEKRFRKIIKEVAAEIPEIEGSLLTDTANIERDKLALKLEKINIELEKMFKKELDENKRKEALIIHQARLAAMGEMIGNIAHQWRQPLNNLSLVLSNIEDAYMYDELDKEYLNSTIDRSRKLISKMSETIDDFRYFLNPKNEKQKFSVYENIITVLDLVEDNLKFNNIKVTFDEITLSKGYGYPNQYSQAIFNIINNSIDALVNRDINNKYINISVYEDNDRIISKFSDNGGGISEEVGEKIFDMYFTTKGKSGGTGLGLYMTKSIIENNMKGRISWENNDCGVTIRVSIPKDMGSEEYGD